MTEENKVRSMMRIKRIDISRNEYDKNNPFRAEIYLVGGVGYPADIKLRIDEDRTEQIINHIADLILDATGVMISDLREDAKALIEEKRAKELPAPIEPAPEPEAKTWQQGHDDDFPL